MARLSREAVEAMLEALVQSLPAAEARRLGEVELARALGVSRTPIREALIALEAKGLVRSRPNAGFAAGPLDEEVVAEVFPIMGVLEGLCVASSVEALREDLDAMQAAADAFRAASDPAAQHRADSELHRLLRGRCDNRRLMDAIDGFKRQLARLYPDAFPGLAPASVADAHDRILAAIRQESAARAEAAVRAHWSHGLDAMIQSLRARQSGSQSAAVSPARRSGSAGETRTTATRAVPVRPITNTATRSSPKARKPRTR